MTDDNSNGPLQVPMAVLFTSRDMSRAVPFYRDVLGFRMKESWPDDGAPLWCNMVLGGQSVMLGATASEASCAPGQEDDAARWMLGCMKTFEGAPAGAGAFVYVRVDDVDAYHAQVTARGAEAAYAPKTQFYGIRDFALADPDGYQIIFYEPVTMQQCQSCGMPLMEAEPGQMYCQHCTDEKGRLKPYETVLQGTVHGYFMGMLNMEQAAAEAAAREHLAKMPAWAGRG